MATPRRAPDVQLSLTCEGMTPDDITEDNIGDVFAVWVDRIADLNAAIAAHHAEGALSPERARRVESTWHARTGAWRAPFERKLNDVMVGAFYHDDDYDQVRAHLIAKFGKDHE